MDITALFKLSSGLYIICAKDEEKKALSGFAGCVVNTVLQATSKPVTISVCINKENYTNACIKTSKEFTVSILSEKIKENIIGSFGFHSSKDKDKFSDAPYALSPSGLPYIKEGVTGFLQCRVIDLIDNYTHTIFAGEVTEAQNISSEPPMTYEYYHKVIKGKAPRNASTYVEESPQTAASAGAEGGGYKCSMCGYEHSGTKEEFEKLPADYTCPMCGASKNLFEPV
jgi:flavin reductase (DIM6/NTAB) family NADH-FMN oxidoreductase RutF/rubredoxin